MKTKKDEIRRCVLTGGPCCGKTSLINELRKRGFSSLDEIARKVLNEIKCPSNNKEFQNFQSEVFLRQLKEEERIFNQKQDKEIVFLDRSLIDSYAYFYHKLGYVPENISKLPEIDLKNRYSLVFVLDLLPFKKDGIRIEEDSRQAEKIHKKIISTYENFGYSLIFVSAKYSLLERADFILNIIERRYE
jgi:predicted ATPase